VNATPFSTRLARAGLRLLMFAVPVLIACCYGVRQMFRHGRVVDRQTGAGIAGIQVEGLRDDGTPAFSVASASDGGFTVSEEHPPASLRATDVDGALNGEYVTTVVPYDPTGADPLLRLDHP
jgi:hypothetical protein